MLAIKVAPYTGYVVVTEAGKPSATDFSPLPGHCAAVPEANRETIVRQVLKLERSEELPSWADCVENLMLVEHSGTVVAYFGCKTDPKVTSIAQAAA